MTCDLLADPIIRVDGARLTLPGVIEALINDGVPHMRGDGPHSYPGARAHHEAAFHAALVQICAYALHLAGRHKIPVTEQEWRSILAHVPHARGDGPYAYAWHLIAPHDEPCFFQPPADNLDGWNPVNSPAGIDPIRPIKEHDIKIDGQNTAELDTWMFSLIALQTTCASNSSFYVATSRVSGGYASRLFVSTDGSPGQRFCRDLQIILNERDRIIQSSPGYAHEGGLALTWLAPCGSTIPKGRLDPLFLDTPRRVRLIENGAMVTGSQGLRTLGKDACSLTGDPWSPTTPESTLNVTNLSFRVISPIVTGDNDISPSLLQEIRDDDPDPVSLKFSVLTGGQPAKSRGYHTRSVFIPRPIRSLLRRRDQTLANASKERIVLLEKVQKAIFVSLMAAINTLHNASHSTAPGLLNVIRDTWIANEDARFFDDLWSEVLSPGITEARKSWVNRVLSDAIDTVRDGVRQTCHGETYWLAFARSQAAFGRLTDRLRIKS
jgi:hypothetical protein